MAFTFGFYNSVNHDRRYDAVQVGQIFDGIIKDGVYETYKKAMMVKASSTDNQVIVQPGRAWFNHTWSYNDADLPVSMPGPETFNQRIDAVVLDINSANSNRRNSIQVVRGTPHPNYPAKPTMINELEHHQYPLCYVKRTGGVNKIIQADIENAVGTSACPFVIGVLKVMNIDDLLTQWSSQFTTYMNSKKSEWNAFQDSQTYRMEQYEREFFAWMENEKVQYYDFLDHNEIAWRNWFDHVARELDGDIAGHLQKQIDEIAKFAHIYVVDKVLYVPMSGASVEDKKLIFAR